MAHLSARPGAARAASFVVAGVLAWTACGARSAWAGDEAEAPLPPDRTEFVAVPDIGGNSDIGVELGAAATLSRFRDGFYPYRFRIDVIASMSLKNDQRGFRPVEQDHGLRIDVPHFLHERLRLDSRLSFTRFVAAPWYGLGNGTRVEALPLPVGAGSPYDYIHEEVRLRSLLRVKMSGPFDLAFALNLRHEFPDPFPDSKLANDLASRTVIGGRPATLETVGAGIFIDTRDSEFMTRKGIFYQLGIAETVGTAESVAYGEASAVLSHFAKLIGPLSFASRFVASFKFGNVPFYELHTGGVFNPQYLVGGEHGVRGVLLGRFAGLVKMITNLELRITPYPTIKVFHWRFRVGNTAFFDAGRVWADYGSAAADTRTLSLKTGYGGGFFFQFDEAAIFRVEAAYSPTNTSDFPVQFYIGTGMSF